MWYVWFILSTSSLKLMAPWDYGKQDSGCDTVLVYYLIRLSAVNQSQLGVEFFLRQKGHILYLCTK